MMPEQDPKRNWFEQLLRALGYLALGVLALVVVGFGLLAGFCGLTR